MATKLSDVIQRGTHAARPAASLAGIQYFETDTGLLLRDNGSSWDSMSLAALVATKGDLLAGTGAGAVARVGVGTDGLPLVADSSQTSGLNYGNIIGGTAFAPSGLTGSVAASRYVGATASGAPTTGAHLLGDFVVTQDGAVFICTTAGTPGTWTQAGGTGTFTGQVQGTAFKPTGLTGATAASRYVGATASGAPTSGTFAIGDFVIDQTGKVFVCTTAGAPGTWTQAGGSSGAMTLISTQVVTGSSVASVVFSSIPGTYTHLRGFYDGRTTSGNSFADSLLMQFNADTAAHYDNAGLFGGDSTGQPTNHAATSAVVGQLTAGGQAAAQSTAGVIDFPNYAGTTFNKRAVSVSSRSDAVGSLWVWLEAVQWRSTAALTQITFLPGAGNIAIGSVFSLYGIS